MRSALPPAIMLALLAACAREETHSGPPPVTVETTRVARESVPRVLRLTGMLEADETVMIRAETEGRIRSVDFTEGEQVASGDTLFTLDDSEQRAELQAVEAELDYARVEHRRLLSLSKQQVVAQAELDQARAQRDRLAAQRDLLRVRLQKTTIRAPFAGVVGARGVSPGDWVTEGQELVPLVALGRLKAVADVPERAAPLARVGQTVTVTVAAYPDRSFKGQVYFIAPTVSSANRRLPLKAYLPNPNGALRPGMFAEVALEVGRHDRALTVPQQAIVPEGEEEYVFRVRDGHAERVRVKTGLRYRGRVEVLRGLAAGDEVVTAGTQKLGPNSPVVTRNAAAARAGKGQP